MEGILETFGLDWPKFISQVIIVLIVYFILSKYAFGPVLAMLEARRKRIEEGETNLKTIQEEMAKAEEKVQAMLDEANRDAERLIAEARESAEAVRGQKTQEAIKEAQGIIEKAREASKLEHEKTMAELKGDFGRLLIDATSKVTGKVLDDSDQKRINEETAGQVAL
ncbi:MAG: F0F1 ATP synthase subunit B [Verrucomicrobiales bacterium]|jgi:F-type H+-transporting ATPase subunit b|nr:F0F1 ATP synthase subunit B [Verrucomicrobiales bacterium]